MANEAVFVAIGIACVVAVLLFVVFIIYCVKKQQDKEQTRQLRERRAREERQRRQLMRAHVVRPPPYDPNRQNIITSDHYHLPVSPPPAYKEVATPLHRYRNATGIGGLTFAPPIYGNGRDEDVIPTVSRNVAPINTIFSGSRDPLSHTHHYTGNPRDVSGNNISRLAASSTRVPHDVTRPLRPYSAVPSTSVPAISSVSSGRARAAPRQNGQTRAADRFGTYGTGNAPVFKAQTHERVSFDTLTARDDQLSDTTDRPSRHPHVYPSNEGGPGTQGYFSQMPNNHASSHPNSLSGQHNARGSNRRRSSQIDYELTGRSSETQASSHSTYNVNVSREFAHSWPENSRRTENQQDVIAAQPTSDLEDLSLI